MTSLGAKCLFSKLLNEALSCNITKRLFGRFEILLKTIIPENINDKEMVLGLEIGQNEDKDRK